MKELGRIVSEYERASAAGTPLVLASIMKVDGSTYRRPGARLLLSEERWLAGLVSGGCLEGDVMKRAFHRTAGGAAVLVAYDSRAEDDAAWTQALGCNGLVEVLLERLGPGRRVHPVETIAPWLRGRGRGVLVTVFRSPDPSARPGDRLALAPDGTVTHDLEPALAGALATEARGALAGGASRLAHVFTQHGVLEALVEVIAPPPSLLVFGDGLDVAPVLEQARLLGWRTTLVASRRAAAVAGAEPLADDFVTCATEALRDGVPLAGQSAAVVMTHAFARDRAVVELLLASAVPYVGVLGPRRRTERLLRELEAAGPLPPQALARVHAPVGLDLGAEEPEEIALAVVAEIQAFLRGRTGGTLRDAAGPIHAR